MQSGSAITTLFGEASTEFANERFPREHFLHHGALERLDGLVNELMFRHPAHIYEHLGIHPDRGIVEDASILKLPSIAGWVEAIRADLGLTPAQIRCTLICTPPGKGTRKHFDAVEGLTIQLHGRKRWRVERNSAVVLTTRAGTDEASPEMSESADTFTLLPGSASFLPRGWWHDTLALEMSVSLQFELHYRRF